jgi:DNA polymerase I-like protein with 3'-5' exonuclease and polymerase domains
MNEIEEELQEKFPPVVHERYSEKTGKRLKDRVEVFNVGSRQQIARRLSTLGVVFDKVTEKGNPIVDEAVLDTIDLPEARSVSEYLMLQKRYAQVHSWLEHVQDDGRVHGRVISNGAVTGRMTHQSPNMAQVPASHSPYGHECRSCWTVPEGKKLVGFDASGLELRMLAHYMDDKEFTNVLLTEDVHTRNQMAAGLETRPQAKTFIYAFLYGAGDAKIGTIVGGSAKDGAELKRRFLSNTPALESLRERVTRASGRGYLTGLDGRRLRVRSEHAALNTLLQAAGAIVMKKALVILDDYAQQWKLDYKLIGNIHDEVQSEVAADQAEKYGWLAVECLKAAGLEYNLRCPLDGEYKVGATWAETH